MGASRELPEMAVAEVELQVATRQCEPDRLDRWLTVSPIANDDYRFHAMPPRPRLM
jgi:hypothetical protein